MVSGESLLRMHTSKNYNPHNGEVLGEFPFSSVEDTRVAIASAKEAFHKWQKLSFQERASYLWKAAAILKEEGK